MTGFSYAAAFAAMVVSVVGAGRLWRLRRVIAVQPAELARALRSSRARDRLSALAAATRRESAVREADLLDTFVSASALPGGDSPMRVALVNEQLRDLERDLAWGERIPAALSRVSLLVSFLCLSAAITSGVTEPLPLLAIVEWGVAGLVAARATGRVALDTARAHRRGIDTLVAAALAAVGGGDGPPEGGRR